MSVTDMYNCTHGPKKDCHACLIPEMAAALDRLITAAVEGHDVMRGLERYDTKDIANALTEARAVLEKAKVLYVGPAEAALDHGHPHE